VADILNRYAGVDVDWLPMHESSVDCRFSKALNNLHLHIMEFLVKAVCYLALDTAQRSLRNLTQHDGWQIQLQLIKDNDEACQKLALSLAIEDQRKHLQTLVEYHQKNDRLLQDTMQALECLLDQNQKVSSWVTTIDVESDHDLVRQKLGEHYADSGTWLRPTFEAWRDSSTDPTFWLRGSGMYYFILPNRP
jgi:hypothetical protein